MDLHRKLLASLCRLCGGEKTPSSKFVSKRDLSRDIENSLSVKFDNDADDIHPPEVCSTCRLKVSRWKKNKYKRKSDLEPPNIQLAAFQPHTSDCPICVDKQWEPSVTSGYLQGRGYFSWENEINGVVAVCVDSGGNGILKKVTVKGKNIKCFVLGKELTLECSSLHDLDKKFLSAPLCTGNGDFQELAETNREKGFLTQSGDQIACVEPFFFDGSRLQETLTIRHKECRLIIPESVASASNRSFALCDNCTRYRSTLLRSMEKQRDPGKSDQKSIPTKFLSPEQLRQKVEELRKTKVNLEQKNRRYKLKIERLLKEEGLEVSEHDFEKLRSIMESSRDKIEAALPSNTFCELLWKEQIKAHSKPSKQMRWHPAVIRWAVAIHTKSASAYGVLRDSGFLTLPHPKTLYKYTHTCNPQTGINPDILMRLVADFKVGELPQHARHVGLLVDEMKVSSGLAFSKSTGKLIGFCDIGPISSEMKKFEERCISDDDDEPKLASHILLYMVRGLTTGMKFPVAYFATNSLTGTQLYEMTYEVIQALKLCGLNVLCLVSDGAASNRKMYQILGGKGESDLHPAYFCKDWYGSGKLYFVCDVPHLLKTIRNNVENSNWNRKTRNLMFRGQRIQWTQIVDLYHWDQGRSASSPGLRLAPKLTYEHVHLTPGLRMKVRLAAQVFSRTVANGLEMMKKPGLNSTILLLRNVNKFFDCLNVASLEEGRRLRNDDLLPYTSVTDPRFQWLKEDLLNFFKEWVEEGEAVERLTKKERGQLCISRATLAGIYITVSSFEEVAKKLLVMDGVKYLLSDKLNQDPLEEFFAKQRGAGGHSDNPSIEQFGHAYVRNITAGSLIRGSSRANVRSMVRNQEESEEPLPKRKRSDRFGSSHEAPH